MTSKALHPPGSNRASAIGRWELVPVELLKPAERRTRTHSGWKRQILDKSIAENGMLDPITINADGVIVDGHLRWEIARQRGFLTVPAIRVEHLSDAELRAYAIAANKLPGVASYDLTELRMELEHIRAEVPKLDFTVTGFTIGELDRIEGRHIEGLYNDLDETDEPSARPIARAKEGEIYACGPHRIACGNSLDPSVLGRLLRGEEACAAFLDPPYNVKINGHVSSSGNFDEFAMGSGEFTRTEFEGFLQVALSNVRNVLRDGAIAFVCMDHAHLGELLVVGERVFDARLNVCVWDKGRGGMGALYRSQHEMVAVFKRGTAPHLNNISLGKNGRNRTNVWSIPGMAGFGNRRKKALELHPTVKPVGLIAEALLDVTAPGDIVLDVFGGSGSTMIAAERIGRLARLIELDPVYVDRAIDRWERLTGERAELLSEPVFEPCEPPHTVGATNDE